MLTLWGVGVCFLGGEEALWVGVATSPSSSGFFPQSEQVLCGGCWAGERAGAESWGWEESRPFQVQVRLLWAVYLTSGPRVQLESFNLIGLISKGSGYKEEQLGLGRRGVCAIYKPYPWQLCKETCCLLSGEHDNWFGGAEAWGRRGNRDPDVGIESEVEALGALFVH